MAGPYLKLKPGLTGTMRFGFVPSSCIVAAAFVAPLPVLSTPAAAQNEAQSNPDRWQITLGNGQIIWDVRLVRLDGDSLHVRQGDSLVVVSVGQITELRLIQKTEVREGDMAGGAMPALMGSDDEVYDLSPLEFADRLRAVQKIFLYHPPEGAPPGPRP
ncbi:MAG: hypothetical protein ACM34D_08690 [Gemmatimonadota bacterium]